ncbi:hypothetical protein NBRC116493_19790 [Aurantivibrio infirmus]
MSLVINTNVSSLNAQRQLVKSGAELSQASERLASGRRINSAKDDAAGLAITNRLTSQVRGLDQAVRNANDGISLIQTAEGALEETTNILQRVRELSIQSANGIYTNTDRATLDAEVQQLVAELDRIADVTTFNGQKLLDGSLKNVELQVGSQANQTIGLSIDAIDADKLGLGSQAVDLLGSEINLAASVFSATAGTDIRDGDVLINGQSIGTFETGTAAANTLSDLVQSITDNVSGVTASAVTQLEASQVGSGIIDNDAGQGFNITVTELNGAVQTYQVRENTTTLSELVDVVNGVTGGAINASLNDDGELVLANNSGATIAVSTVGGLNLQTSLGTNSLVGDGLSQNGQLILTSDNDEPITIERGNTGTLVDLHNLGFRESSAQGVIEGAGLAAAQANTAWGVGDVTINGQAISTTNTDSLAGKINAINSSTNETGVTANAFSTVGIDLSGVTVATAFAGTASSILINGTTVDFSADTTIQALADRVNLSTNTHGVVASVLGNSLQFESDQGAIVLGAATVDSAFGAIAAEGFTGASFIEFAPAGAEVTVAGSLVGASLTVEAGIKLTSDSGNPISVELGVNANAAEVGLLEANNTAAGAFGSALSSVSIKTAAQAQKAIEVVDNALETINNTRSALGAVNNRLDFTISNLSNVSEKTASARSRIFDADFARETAELSRAQVLQQASTAILAQANARPQQVLSLLQ